MFVQNRSKGRGAQINTQNKFSEHEHVFRDDFLNHCEREGDEAFNSGTTIIETFPKTIVNKVNSPDVGMNFSLNPYQGCEHGCIYCYARNSHEYWGYSAGMDFEQKILVKRNAVELLEKKLSSNSWQAEPIVLSGNTDCYQPIEKKLQITRELLKTFLRFRHPVGIITKNSLILRDLDILKELHQHKLVAVNVSITSLYESTRRLLEPRTATIAKRLQTVKTLSETGIPVNVMMAPIIPGLNNHEILPLVKKVSEMGASSVGYTIVRLNGSIGKIFTDWVRKTMPDRADKIIHQIENIHGGSLNDSRFGVRMKGEGKFAEQVSQQFRIARNRYLKGRSIDPLNCGIHHNFKSDQLKLF